MAKKNNRSRGEEMELDQAYFDLTGYDNTSPKKNSIGGVLIGAVCLLALVLAGAILGIPFLLEDTQPTTPVDPGSQNVIQADTNILGVNLGGMTAQEATAALNTLLDGTMSVTINGESYPVSLADSIASFDTQGAVAALLEDPQQFKLSDWLTPNTDAIRDQADSYAVMHQQQAVPTTYAVIGEMPSLEQTETEPECQTLVIVKGKPSSSIDNEALYQGILQSLTTDNPTVEVPVTYGTLEALDLTSVYNANHIAPVDAVMDMETFLVSGGTYGYGFNVEQAQAALDAADFGAVIEIPFFRTAPEISAESLEALLFRDVLASASTPHTDEFNRNTNLKLACQAINGVVLYPGQEFSYNATLGERTTEKGYLPAASYIGEDTVDTVGGGICQVSSTLYYTTLLADLMVTYRACHGFTVDYLPLGMDATVSWGGYDFCFVNDSRYPLRIEAWVSDGYVNIQLIGTEERTYYVEMEYYVDAVYPYETVERELPTDNPNGYKDGDVIVTPYTGYEVYTYRCRYDRETKTLLFKDYEGYSEYWVRNEVIAKITDTSQANPAA